MACASTRRYGGTARSAEGRDVAAHEVDGIAPGQLLPRERAVLAGRQQLVAENGDRPLADFVDVREGTPLRPARVTGMDGHAALLELLAGTPAELVLGERGEDDARPGEVRELDGGDGATSSRLLPGLECVHDLARLRRMVDAGELHPLDMTDHCDLHDLTS